MAHSRQPRAGDRRRTLSQNFLTDPSLARRIVRIAGVGPDDRVVEVGAGEGILTRALASACRAVTAYELDPRLAAALAARRIPGVRVVHQDFLRSAPPGGAFSVVGNIPYAITSPIVGWCLNACGLTSATLLTQWEYARKRTGGNGRWSRLTVQTWPLFSWRLAGRIPRDRFDPIPRVDAGVLLLRHRQRPLLPPGTLGDYRRLVELGFTGVGGSLRASLRRGHPPQRVDAALAAAGVDRAAVVAFVSPDQWIRIFTHLHGLRGVTAAQEHEAEQQAARRRRSR
ncbi:MAG: ErmE/ErmH/ErmO/ErmR family 23S rRNA (adenine(2058)-N(6))-methyltransferase [Nocardiopsaceae bacterium]|nr:ErmE/ErmH/ErmO/ErmR family 23S rRNA (adenine(2058)-N(6))-methyltransferase [Nocardiopsaceae bacterium]